jgi:hypothetical protein
MEKEKIHGWKVGKFMMENGSMIKSKDMEYTSLVVVLRNMKANIIKIRDMEKESMFGWMEIFMMGSGSIIFVRGRESSLKVKVENMKVNGHKIKDMEKENKFGMMEEFMKENGWMVFVRVMEFRFIVMVTYMRANG